jgi:transcriptional regulator with XRE-family HTH domain
MPSKKKQIRHAEVVRLFAGRLRERRLGAGLTQAGLAEAAGVTPTYVTRLEAAGAAPGIDTVARLADALGTTVHDLLPVPTPPETLAALKARASTVLDQLLQKADRDVVDAVTPVLSQLADGVIKGRLLACTPRPDTRTETERTPGGLTPRRSTNVLPSRIA